MKPGRCVATQRDLSDGTSLQSRTEPFFIVGQNIFTVAYTYTNKKYYKNYKT